MYKISKQFSFSASHILNGLSEDHPCARLHGHNYLVILHLKAEKLDETGFVQDYRSLQFVKEFIDKNLDHRHLNDILPFNPTAENLAKYFYDTFKSDIATLFAVEVCETPKTSAVYEAER